MTTTTTKTPGKKAPGTKAQRIGKAMATQAAKAPAKKAAPKPPAKAATPAGPKLRWQVEGDRNNKRGRSRAPRWRRTYAIKRSGDTWVATVTVDGKAEVLGKAASGPRTTLREAQPRSARSKTTTPGQAGRSCRAGRRGLAWR